MMIHFLAQSNAQKEGLNLVIDTISSFHSKYKGVYDMEIAFDNYLISKLDSISLAQGGDRDLVLSKYQPVRNYIIPEGEAGWRSSIFSRLTIICGQQYSFVIPYSNYSLERSNLLNHGLTIQRRSVKKDFVFCTLKPVIVNFYLENKAIFYREYASTKIEAKEFIDIEEIVNFDQLEIVISNEYDDVLKMNFFLTD